MLDVAAMAEIEIKEGPKNVTAAEGQSAIFYCKYNGTDDLPIWYISGASYLVQGGGQGLPERHTYSKQSITVHNVQVSDDGRTYYCSFLFGKISSSTAILTVIPALQGK